MSDEATVKVSADLTPELLRDLKELAVRRGLSANQVLQQAISTEKLFADSVGKGDKVLIHRPNNTTQQVLFSRE